MVTATVARTCNSLSLISRCCKFYFTYKDRDVVHICSPSKRHMYSRRHFQTEVCIYIPLVSPQIKQKKKQWKEFQRTVELNSYSFKCNMHKCMQFIISWLIGFRFMVFNATFNNISVISWWSVLLVRETGAPKENPRPVASHWQTLSHNFVSSTPRHEWNSNSQYQWWLALVA